MGTTWSAKFIQPASPAPPLDPAAVSTQIAARLEALEAIFSTYRPASELSRFNTSPTVEWQPVSPELARVAVASRELSALTGGAFDATVGPLVSLWGFGPQRRTGTKLPTSAEIAAARARVDYRRLEARLAPPALRKSDLTLSADFASMAKGFSADELSILLTALGAPDHLVQVGGDLKTSGHPSGAPSWSAGIENPPSPSSAVNLPATLATTVTLAGEALSTSGDSHNAFTVGRRRYGHIIDPRTGRPAQGPLASVSVIHPSCAQSSAIATALFVLGADAGFHFAEKHHLAALFIVRDAATAQLALRPTSAFTKFAAPATPASPPATPPAPALPLTAPGAR